MAKRKAATFGQDIMKGEWGGQTVNAIDKTSIPSEFAMGENYDNAERTITGTSLFDPTLCELAYRWFSPVGGTVLDPFAGGSVRGIVAARLDRHYVGIDLSERQVEANRGQAAKLCKPPYVPSWHVGDSTIVLADATLQTQEFDFIFSCPPYFDLEVYSEDPRDLSTMPYGKFRAGYAEIIALACKRLKEDRFACFVVGDVRDKSGAYRNLPGHTIEAFEAAGLRLYNDAILVTAAGSLPIRVGRQFETARKLGNTHQRVLLFIKGNAKKATEAIGHVEFGEPEEFEKMQADLAMQQPGGEPINETTEFGERVTSLGGEVV